MRSIFRPAEFVSKIREPASADLSRLRHVAHVRPSVELFLISFLILFLELACIRWLGSTVIFLTFFTNIVLMACFLGVSVGCLAASRQLVMDERVRSAGDLDRGLGVRFLVGLQRVQPGRGRRRIAAVAAADLLRHRWTGEGPVEMGGADRGAGRLTSSFWSRCCSSGPARRWGGGSPPSTTGCWPTRPTSSAAWRASRSSA